MEKCLRLTFPRENTMEEVVAALRIKTPSLVLNCAFDNDNFNSSEGLREVILSRNKSRRGIIFLFKFRTSVRTETHTIFVGISTFNVCVLRDQKTRLSSLLMLCWCDCIQWQYWYPRFQWRWQCIPWRRHVGMNLWCGDIIHVYCFNLLLFPPIQVENVVVNVVAGVFWRRSVVVEYKRLQQHNQRYHTMRRMHSFVGEFHTKLYMRAYTGVVDRFFTLRIDSIHLSCSIRSQRIWVLVLVTHEWTIYITTGVHSKRWG